MKLQLDLDTNDLIYDVLNAGFVAMLKRQLKDSTDYLDTTCLHEHDVIVQNQVINSCKNLLEYCTGEIYD